MSPLSTIYLFVHYHLVALLDSCPVELKARCFGGSLFRRKVKVVSSFRVVCRHSRAGGYGGTVCVSASLTCLFHCGVFPPDSVCLIDVGVTELLSEFLSEGLVLFVAVDLVSVGGGNFGTLFSCHL